MSPRTAPPLNLEYILLALLDWRPMHGYELYQELCALPGIVLVWNIKQGLLYALLEKLEARGLVTSRMIAGGPHPDRKEYSPTAAGRRALEEWIASPVRRPRDLRQEFLAKLVIARRYGNARALALLEAQRRACLEWKAGLEANRPRQDGRHIDEWLVYSFRVKRLEGALEWLAACETELAGAGPDA